jgi:HD-GYP domain-containing protein (c-di-GMP phosphodiesterase class II)
MLHDVGKVAISDTILKKPGRLTEDEFHVIKYHTLAGAHLFRDPTSELDALSAEIALNHHEKWNGAGYPGRTNLDAAYENLQYGPGRHNDEIPLSGRIVALCDVFDALIETRCYKGAWPEEKVLGIIEEESGKHFDPDIVEAFFGIYDVIKAIRERFREPGA